MPNRFLARPPLEVAARLLEGASLPTADLTESHMDHFWFCGPASAPTGLVGLEVCGPDALLRSLVVSPGERACGLGSALVEHVEAEARSRGLGAIYLLTTTAEPFFKRRGYVAADRAGAPAGIRATREFSGICPASSAFMMKRL